VVLKTLLERIFSFPKKGVAYRRDIGGFYIFQWWLELFKGDKGTIWGF